MTKNNMVVRPKKGDGIPKAERDVCPWLLLSDLSANQDIKKQVIQRLAIHQNILSNKITMLSRTCKKTN